MRSVWNKVNSLLQKSANKLEASLLDGCLKSVIIAEKEISRLLKLDEKFALSNTSKAAAARAVIYGIIETGKTYSISLFNVSIRAITEYRYYQFRITGYLSSLVNEFALQLQKISR